MIKYKIIYNKNECIGAGECETLSPEFWKLENDGNATLKNAIIKGDKEIYELEIDETEVNKQKLIVDSCPVGCIKIIKIE